jgi:hypothetical protein
VKTNRSIHESGHAVVAAAYGRHCDMLSIVSSRDTNVIVEATASIGGLEENYDKAVMNLSGAVAELIDSPLRADSWRTGALNWAHDARSLLSECQAVREGQLNYDWKCPCGVYSCLVHDNPAKNSFEESVQCNNEHKEFQVGFSENKHNTMIFWLLTNAVPSPLDITDQDFEDFELILSIFEDSKRILTEQWDIVVRLAAVLEHKKTLTAEQIKYVVEYAA